MKLLKEYINHLILREQIDPKDISPNHLQRDMYRGFKSPKPGYFHKSLIWADYYYDALGIGMSEKESKKYADKETKKDEIIYKGKERLYLPK